MNRIRTRLSSALCQYAPLAMARQVMHCVMPSAIRPLDSIPTVFVDVSMIAQHDARTGIQRIVRVVVQGLLACHRIPLRVQLVHAARRHGYRLARWDSAQGRPVPDILAAPLAPKAGDVFLALDLTAHLLPRHFAQLFEFRAAGLQVVPVVYDLLPDAYPEWFNDMTVRNFRRWLTACAKLADGYVTISATVRNELRGWLAQRSLDPDTIPIAAIPLVGGIVHTYPTRGVSAGAEALLEEFRRTPTILMVSTIEPRKGYETALDAFEALWGSGFEANLVIVGKRGWKTEDLQCRLETHPQRNRHLFWFEDANDEWLTALYQACHLVLMASRGEGLGLPLIEAMDYGKPVLARDLLVFREMGGNAIHYFSDDRPDALAGHIADCLAAPHSSARPALSPSWREGVAQLVNFVLALRRPALANETGRGSSARYGAG